MSSTMTDDGHSHSGTEATPEPEGPPQRPTRRPDGNIWEDDESLPSLPPMPSPLEYSASAGSPLGGVFVTSDDTSTFSDKSLEDRLHRTLNHNISVENQYHKTQHKMALEPTLEVARLVQQVDLLRETNQELRNENKMLVVGGKSLEAQMEDLVEARMTAELREREARQESASLRQELGQANVQLAERDKEIQELKAQLESMSAASKKQHEEEQAVVKQAREEAKREISMLSGQNASLEQEKNDLAKVLEETQTLLEKATLECKARKACVDVSVQTDVVPAETKSRSDEFLSIETDTESTNTNGAVKGRMDGIDDLEALVSMAASHKNSTTEHHSDSLPIGERLYRIRDAAERASLVKEHRREMSRLGQKYEAEKKQLQQKFEKEKDTLLEEAMEEMNAGYKGLRRRLESEHDKKMEKVERQHRQEIDRVSFSALCVRIAYNSRSHT